MTGASRGIGRAVALGFAREGARVAVHHRDSEKLAGQVAAELAGTGHLVVQADVAAPEQAERLVARLVEEWGGLDVLVNNAGVSIYHDLAQMDFDEWRAAWDRTIAVNLSGPAFLSYFAARAMIREGGGRIINVSSRGAFRGEPDQPGYAASKAGLNALGQSLARALAPHGISVMTVAPGWVETDMAQQELKTARGPAIFAQSPFNRIARPEEVAAAVLYFASPQAEFTSGAILDVNGASYLRT